MKTTLIWSLAVLNVLLLASFVSTVTGGDVTAENAVMAQAQPGAVRARPGEYIMIPGDVTGGSSAVVYMIDTVNRKLGAMAYDDAQKQLQVMAPIALDRVFDAAAVAPNKPEEKDGGTRRNQGGYKSR